MSKKLNTEYNDSNITITFNTGKVLHKLISEYKFNKIFVLVDENTLEFCFPFIKNNFPEKVNILKIKSGEEYKIVKTLHRIWGFLLENKADRSSLLINLGGGVITDIGGFAASTYKRGMDFINIPTSLLAQIDASTGGKTGVNYAGMKNIIGVINFPKHVIIDPTFIKTLDRREFISGYAEMIKQALLHDEKYLNELLLFFPNKNAEINYNNLYILISKSIEIKKYFVKKDPFEKGLRKALNFGHTFGHAFESLFSKKTPGLKHGEAIAQGIICELFLSNKKCNFNLEKFLYCSEKIINIFGKININELNTYKLIELMRQDKKNTNNKINCTLLKNIGTPIVNNIITENEIKDTLLFYKQLSK